MCPMNLLITCGRSLKRIEADLTGRDDYRMDQKKEIIVFTDSMGNCGINRVLSELTDVWINYGHKVTVAYIKRANNRQSDFSWRPEIELVGIPCGKKAASTYFDLTCYYVRLLRSRPNAVAVSLSVMTNFAIGAAAPFVKNKIVISDRNDPRRRPAGRVKQFFRDMAFKQADVLILQTEEVKKYYEERIHMTGVVIPNPINNKMPAPIRGGGTRRPVIVTASRLNKQKNLGMLIEAFSKISSDHPDYTVEIFGRGDEEENLKRKAEEFSVAGKVIFKGFSSNIFEDIRDCSMYVCTSDYEGISNALLEALGMGLPTISTDCPVGGSKLLIENDVNGILVDVGDVDALSSQMERLICNPEFAETLSENAVSVRSKYAAEKIAQLWIDNM